MAARQITVSYDIDDRLLASLEQTLKVQGKTLERRLSQLAGAALEEYVFAFTGTRSPTGIRDVRELRLCLLYKHLPEKVPDDQQVAELFQLTSGQAATLIAGARARYRSEIESRLRAEARTAVRVAKDLKDGNWRIALSDSLAAFVKELIRRAGAAAPRASRGASRQYDLSDATMTALKAQLGPDPSGTAP